MAAQIIETLDSSGKLNLSNLLDANTREYITYTETSEITTDSQADGIIYRKYNGKYLKRNFSRVNIKWFGAKGDGVTDDSVARDKCFDFCKTRGFEVFFPVGVYRITYGYTQGIVRRNLTICGEARTSDDTNLNLGAIILLDNIDQTSFFYELTANHQFEVKDIRFRCKQFVKDREFIKFNTGSANHRFTNVLFENIEKPIVYKPGSYFQMAAFTNVQFNDSGTFHSQGTTGQLIGTLLTLISVSHDGAMLDNTEKVVCNLTGIRWIQGVNFLLEGSLPSTGWTALKLNNSYDTAYGHAPTANFTGFWSEWNTNQPQYTLDQSSGRVMFKNSNLTLSPTTHIKLSNRGQLNIEGSSFLHQNLLNSFFEVEDFKCNIVLDKCTMRSVDVLDKSVLLNDCCISTDASAIQEDKGSSVITTSQSALLYRWDGGIPDGDYATFNGTAGTTSSINTDSTYGRKMIVVGGTRLQLYAGIKMRDVLSTYAQYWILAYIQLPIYTGTFIVAPYETSQKAGISFDVSKSGQKVFVCLPTKVTTGTVSVQAIFDCQTASTPLEIMAFEIYGGNSAPRFPAMAHPNNITTFAAAAPTTGSWKKGDKVYSTAAVNGGNAGWHCSVSGAPGTWVPFGYVGNDVGKPTAGSTVSRPTVTTIGFDYFDSTLGRPVTWNGSAWVNSDPDATTAVRGLVLKAAAVPDIATADATDLPTAITLANANKAKMNALLAALRTAGILT